MKKLAKLWEFTLIAIMGIFGSGCILDPPEPEYGVEPLYGVPAAYQGADEEPTELPATESEQPNE